MGNAYIPFKARIALILQETSSDVDIKTFRIKPADKDKRMDFMPGQFFEFSVPGVGEAPFGFASSPYEKDFFEVSIKKTGLVTEVIHNLKPGDTVWIRGPLGNSFPVEKMEGSNILVVAGGLGLAPLRPLILYMLEPANRSKYKNISMLLAARSSGDFIYMRDISEWSRRDDTEVILTIDRPEEGWKGKVGFPHNLLGEMQIDISDTYAITCGPPIMIKFVSGKLVEMGIPKSKIYTTLEMRMTCGVGKCGKCNIGHKYVCVDGPVFSMEELSGMPQEY
ncbi:MAG: hydrogenase [Clostridiaceae bacterium]|nr:hydrogenase [Clostridiaceae bacterium]